MLGRSSTASCDGRVAVRVGSGPSEILRLGKLYRIAAADLALARRTFPQAAGTERLQGLVISAHCAGVRAGARTETAGEFFSHGVWRRIRETGRCLTISIAVLVGAVVLGALWALTRPGLGGRSSAVRQPCLGPYPRCVLRHLRAGAGRPGRHDLRQQHRGVDPGHRRWVHVRHPDRVLACLQRRPPRGARDLRVARRRLRPVRPAGRPPRPARAVVHRPRRGVRA